MDRIRYLRCAPLMCTSQPVVAHDWRTPVDPTE